MILYNSNFSRIQNTYAIEEHDDEYDDNDDDDDDDEWGSSRRASFLK